VAVEKRRRVLPALGRHLLGPGVVGAPGPVGCRPGDRETLLAVPAADLSEQRLASRIDHGQNGIPSPSAVSAAGPVAASGSVQGRTQPSQSWSGFCLPMSLSGPRTRPTRSPMLAFASTAASCDARLLM